MVLKNLISDLRCRFETEFFEIDSASSEMDKALVHDEMHDDPENEEAYYLSKGKGKGKGYDPNISCQRCGKRGHPSHWCRLTWEQGCSVRERGLRVRVRLSFTRVGLHVRGVWHVVRGPVF